MEGKAKYPIVGQVVMSLEEYKDLISELNEATELSRMYRDKYWEAERKLKAIKEKIQ